MKIKAIVTGASGMVGEGVLLECLQRDDVEQVLVVGRRPCGTTHPKLKEVLHSDFFNLTPIESALRGYNACFFCLGVSSVGMKEPEYFRLTHTLTLLFAETVARLNPDMSFCYISGASTDSTEKGRLMWARVKGKTENDLQKLPFKAEYNFRPGALIPTEGQKNVLPYYRYFGWLVPVIRLLAPGSISTLAQLGQGMINAVVKGYDKPVLEIRDFVALAQS